MTWRRSSAFGIAPTAARCREWAASAAATASRQRACAWARSCAVSRSRASAASVSAWAASIASLTARPCRGVRGVSGWRVAAGSPSASSVAHPPKWALRESRANADGMKAGRSVFEPGVHTQRSPGIPAFARAICVTAWSRAGSVEW